VVLLLTVQQLGMTHSSSKVRLMLLTVQQLGMTHRSSKVRLMLLTMSSAEAGVAVLAGVMMSSSSSSSVDVAQGPQPAAVMLTTNNSSRVQLQVTHQRLIGRVLLAQIRGRQMPRRQLLQQPLTQLQQMLRWRKQMLESMHEAVAVLWRTLLLWRCLRPCCSERQDRKHECALNVPLTGSTGQYW
jgi:hypothetical protein